MITATGLSRPDNPGQEATIKPILLMFIALALIAACGGGPPIDFVPIPLQFSQVHEIDTVLDNDTAYIDIRVYNPSEDSVWVPYEVGAIELWPASVSLNDESDSVEYVRVWARLESLGRAHPAPGFRLGPESQIVLSEVFLFRAVKIVPWPDSMQWKREATVTDFQLRYGVRRKVQGRQLCYTNTAETSFRISYRELIPPSRTTE